MISRAWANIKNIFESREMRLSHYFDEIELELVIPRLLGYVYNLANCENVVWLTAKQFQDFKSQQPGRIEPDPEQFTMRDLRLQAIKHFDESLVSEVVNRFAPNVSAATVLKNTETHSDLLVPILDVKTREVMAFVLLLKISNSEAETAKIRLEQDLAIMARHIGFSLKHWESCRLSYLDDLTGLFNQKFMTMALENEIFRAQREGLKISVLFMDVDFFKNVNDTKGHLVGSRLLVEVGRALKTNLRRSDYAFRYGGDEYVVILPNAAASGAQVAAERIRRVIEQTNFVIDGEPIRLTLSIGLATYPDHAKTHKDIIRMADEAMYCGKHKSRNVVFVAS